MMINKIAVITGFGSGLGENLAFKFIDKAYKVIGLSRTISENNTRTNHENIIQMKCDVSDSKMVSNVFEEIRIEYGRPSILIHNAALLQLEDFLKITPEQFEHYDVHPV